MIRQLPSHSQTAGNRACPRTSPDPARLKPRREHEPLRASHDPAATVTLTDRRKPCLSPNIARSGSSEASAGARALAGAVLFLDRRQSWCTPSLLAAETSLYSCSPERLGKKVRFQAMRSKPASPRTLCDRWHQSSSKRSVGPSIVTETAPFLAFSRVCARTAGPT
jgi:hypothetical protein